MKICNPQLEKGHTRIANELLEAIIIYPFNATDYKIILAIIRKTYGWKKKSAPISYGAVTRLTGRDKRHIRRAIDKLICDRVILRDKTKGMNILGLNKRYLEWRLWITLKDRGENTPHLGAGRPSEMGNTAPKNEGNLTPTLNKERNIYKERSRFYPQHPKDPVHIKDVIKSIT